MAWLFLLVYWAFNLAHNLTFFVNFSFNSQHLQSCKELLGELDAKGEAK